MELQGFNIFPLPFFPSRQGRGKQLSDSLVGGIFLFGRYGDRPYCFRDSPYRAGINPAPTIIISHRSHLRLARLAVPLCLAPCALCPVLYASCATDHGFASGGTTDGLFPPDLHVFPQWTLEAEASQFFLQSSINIHI